jgi:hypothetical protein
MPRADCLPFPGASRLRSLAAAVACLALAHAGAAQALPSYARQTAQPCTGCHVGGFGPQLTPFGREFKLRGYTMQGGDGSSLPVSAMLVASFTHTASDQPEPAGPHDGSNDNGSLQELSLFAAGRLSSKLGTFVQATYSDIDRHVALDNVELRFAQPFTRGSHAGVWGVSVNNSPGLSDLRHTQGVWRFPFVGPELAPAPEAAPLVDEGLAQQVLGAEAYVSVDGKWYASFGLYDTLSPAFRARVNADDTSRLAGLAPYWRVTRQLPHNITLGASGLHARLRAGGGGGLDDRYDDVGVDAAYEAYVREGDTLIVNASWMHERQRLDGSFAAGAADDDRHTLDSANLNASYYFANRIGLTAAWFSRSGSRDASWYPDSPSGGPGARGEVLQCDWTPFGSADSWGKPWANLRLGLQYTHYDRFNGAASDYDGEGRDASDNDTLFLFAWFAM